MKVTASAVVVEAMAKGTSLHPILIIPIVGYYRLDLIRDLKVALTVSISAAGSVGEVVTTAHLAIGLHRRCVPSRRYRGASEKLEMIRATWSRKVVPSWRNKGA